MGLLRTVSEINGNFSRKSQFFPSLYLMPPLNGFLQEVTPSGLKKLEWWGYLAEKKLDDIYSRPIVPRLRIASRSKN